METENNKLLKSLEDIQMGKRLNVASHSVKGGPKKSLIYGAKKLEQVAISSGNQKLIQNIVNVKPTVPNAIKINERW